MRMSELNKDYSMSEPGLKTAQNSRTALGFKKS